MSGLAGLSVCLSVCVSRVSACLQWALFGAPAITACSLSFFLSVCLSACLSVSQPHHTHTYRVCAWVGCCCFVGLAVAAPRTFLLSRRLTCLLRACAVRTWVSVGRLVGFLCLVAVSCGWLVTWGPGQPHTFPWKRVLVRPSARIASDSFIMGRRDRGRPGRQAGRKERGRQTDRQTDRQTGTGFALVAVFCGHAFMHWMQKYHHTDTGTWLYEGRSLSLCTTYDTHVCVLCKPSRVYAVRLSCAWHSFIDRCK